MLGAAPDAAVLALAEGMHGNPFWLTELFSGLRDEHLVTIGAGRATLAGGRLPRRVSDTMRRRLGRMSPAAQDVAAVAASMGRRFTIGQLAVVLDVPASALLHPVEELLAAELFTGCGAQLSFSHDLNREAVRASQPSSAAQALDRQVAAALLAAGALPVEVATQLASSAAAGDEVAITTLMKASDALASTDPGQAAGLARRALDLAGGHHLLRGPLVARVAVLLHAAARSEEAMAFADGALRQVLSAEQEAEVRLSIANLFSISPDVRAESCRRALALPGLPPDLRARLLAQLFHNLVVGGPGRPGAAAPRAGQGGCRGGRRQRRPVHPGAGRGQVELHPGPLRDGAGPGRRVAACQRRCGRGFRERFARHLRCEILAVMDRYDEAFMTATESIRAAQQARQGWALHMFETWRGRQLVQLGQLADAAAALEGRFAPGGHAHLVVSVLDAASVVALGRVAIHTGNQRQAALTAAIAAVMLHSGVPAVQRQAAWLLSLQAQAGGDPAQARRWLGALGEKERLAVFPLVPLDPPKIPSWSASRWPPGTGS